MNPMTIDQLEKTLEQTQRELNAANKAANEADAKVSLYAAAARVIALHLKEFCNESLPYDEMIADAARKAGDTLRKAKEWNALTEVELGLLRGLCHDQEDDIKDLMTTLRELCEKMEAGISGKQETKRARALLEKIA